MKRRVRNLSESTSSNGDSERDWKIKFDFFKQMINFDVTNSHCVESNFKHADDNRYHGKFLNFYMFFFNGKNKKKTTLDKMTAIITDHGLLFFFFC